MLYVVRIKRNRSKSKENKKTICEESRSWLYSSIWMSVMINSNWRCSSAFAWKEVLLNQFNQIFFIKCRVNANDWVVVHVLVLFISASDLRTTATEFSVLAEHWAFENIGSVCFSLRIEINSAASDFPIGTAKYEKVTRRRTGATPLFHSLETRKFEACSNWPKEIVTEVSKQFPFEVVARVNLLTVQILFTCELKIHLLLLLG